MKNAKKGIPVSKEILKNLKNDYIMIFRPKMPPGFIKVIDRMNPINEKLNAAVLVLGETLRQLDEFGLIESDIAGDLNYLFTEYLENAVQRRNDLISDDILMDYEIAEEYIC